MDSKVIIKTILYLLFFAVVVTGIIYIIKTKNKLKHLKGEGNLGRWFILVLIPYTLFKLGTWTSSRFTSKLSNN